MPQSTSSRLTNVLYYGAPLVVAAIGVYRLWTVTGLDGSRAQEAFVVGLLLLVCAALFVAARRSRVRSQEVGALEEAQQTQGQRVRNLENKYEELRQDVDARLSFTAILEAVDRVDARKAGGWVHLNRPRH